MERSEVAAELARLSAETERAFDRVMKDDMMELMPEALVDAIAKACDAMGDLMREIDPFVGEHGGA